jgi:hypothetical protein
LHSTALALYNPEVPRTFKTLSLSLPPGIVEELAALGRSTNRVAARVAAEIVMREIARTPLGPASKQRSRCCRADVQEIEGQFILPTNRWVTATLRLCSACKRQQAC